jgi:hypothetical protein
MKLKTAPAQFKAPGDDGADGGVFEAIVSVFGNVDSWGDVVLPGAFADTIAQWKASPNTLPVLWSHRMDDPTFNIGAVEDLAELTPGDVTIPGWVDQHVRDNGGLWVKGRIDTGPDASPIAVQALRLLKSRRVTQFSYAYDELDSGPVKVDGADAWGLKKIKLYEVSPTQIGANELTELLAAKAAVTAGRVLSGETDGRIRDAIALLQKALAVTPDGDTDSDNTTREEPVGVKRQGSGCDTAASIRLLIDLRRLECAAGISD